MECAHMWDVLVEAHSRAGDGRAAAGTVAEMRASGVPVGYVAHGCAVLAYCNASKFEVGSAPYMCTGGTAGCVLYLRL